MGGSAIVQLPGLGSRPAASAWEATTVATTATNATPIVALRIVWMPNIDSSFLLDRGCDLSVGGDRRRAKRQQGFG
jgi:hypothetical protein